MKRRNFLKVATISIPLVHSSKSLLASGKTLKKKPIVVSTWDFGKDANAASWKILSGGGRAIDAIEAGAKVPEADVNNQTVGYGGMPDRDGRVTLDACIMDEQGNCGSVMCLEHIKHPISVARRIMEKTPHIILVAEGALKFALSEGFKKENLLTPSSEQAWKEWLKETKYQPKINVENESYKKQDDPAMPGGKENHDTIGIIALDGDGNLSGGCTTSGMAFKMPGRVGDSPVIGAGLFVDNEVGAATATGVGEEVIRCVGSHLVVELMRQGLGPTEACRQAVERIAKRNPERAKKIQVGFLALHKDGRHGAFALHKGFSYAVKSEGEEMMMQSGHYFP
jgi:N4-(beta-N-acetylglucosaminyl)-L-asparaginase